MPRFRFNLQPLLRAREIEEQRRQRVVAEIEQQRRALHDRLRAQQETISSGKRSRREALVGQLDVDTLRGEAHRSLVVMRDAQRLVLELAGVHKRLEAARAELAEAVKARRAIELLRDQRYEQWKRAQAKADLAAVDELVTNAAARRKEMDA